MAEKVARLGLIAMAMEAVPGTPESTPDLFVPWTDNTIAVHHEPIDDIAARGSRVQQYGAVAGKLWGEGDLEMYLDSLNCGYLLKMATGQETVTQQNATPPVYDHLLTPTVSGNIPFSATVWDYKGVDWQQFSYMSVDTLEVEIKNDGIATVKAGLMGRGPTTVVAPAQTTTSGTLFTWKDAVVRVGSTVAQAQSASPTKLTDFKFDIANAVDLNYKTGSNQPDTVVLGTVKISGEYTLFFENATDRDNYKNLVKNSLVVTLTGASLGSGFSEQLIFLFKKVILKTLDYTTKSDDLFILKMSFDALWDQDQAGYVDITVRNGKSSTYS